MYVLAIKTHNILLLLSLSHDVYKKEISESHEPGYHHENDYIMLIALLNWHADGFLCMPLLLKEWQH